MMHWKTKESGRTETFALVCFILASVISVDAFQIPKNSLTHHIGVGHKSTSLAVSLATPAVNATGFANEDDDSQGREIQIKIKKEVDPFYKFLKNLSFRVKKKTTLAISMDDELKQLETIYYNLAPHDAHKNSKFSYNGPRVRPDARCYSLVCNSYANAGFGEKGAHLAESAMQRYEEHDGLKSNSFLMTAVMKAWIAADNWEKADFLLQEMENTFAKTQDPDNAPSAKTYTTYISGLSMTKKLDKKEAARKSVKMLDKMLEQYDSGKNPLARPNRFTYSYAMKCQTNAYRGIEGVNRAEKFFRQQQADYDKYNIVSLKPGAISALPVFTASNHCYGSIQAATRMEKILEELQEKYDKTGDTDYRPLEPMYTSLLSTYAKVDGNNAKKCSKEVDKVLEAIEQNGIEPSAHTITSGKY